MLRMLAVSLTALMVAPLPVGAQARVGDRVAITPSVGYRLSHNHDFKATLVINGVENIAEVSHRLESGVVFGADVALNVTRSLGVIGGFMHSEFPGVLETVTVDNEVFQTALPSGSLQIIKAGLALRLPEQGRANEGPRSAVFAALAHVRRSDPFRGLPGAEGPVGNMALNLGWKAEVPVLPRLAAYLSAEDLVTKWNDSELTRRYQAANVPIDDEPLWDLTDVSSSLTHILVARIGVSLRF